MKFSGSEGASPDPNYGAAPKGQTAPPPPPAAPPAAPHHSSQGGGDGGGQSSGGGPSYSGSTPGIDQILGSDPNYQQLLAFDTAASSEDLASMNAKIARMQGYYGSDNDPLSILGRVFQAYKDRNMYIANTLAGHGMINSGETGWQASRATLAYQQQELDARMKLQDYIEGLQDAFRAAQRQQKFNEMQAGWAAVQNWLNANSPTPNGSQGSNGNGDNGDNGNNDNGDTSGAGNYYDVNGNPISPVPAPIFNPFK